MHFASMSVHSDKATTFLYCMLDWSISVLVKQQPEWSAEKGYADVEKICSFCRFFYLSAMNEAIEFVSPPVQLLFFCRRSQTIVSFYVCKSKSMLFRRENFSFNLCCRNYFHTRLQDLQMLTNISSVINKKN